MSDSLLEIFIIESTEKLQEIETALLQLETTPDDEDIINSLFRAAHTIKGSAGVVGFEDIEKFTHKVENVLEQVRQGDINITNELIGLLLRCRDHIESLLDNISSEDSTMSPEQETTGQSLQKEISLYLDTVEDTSSATEGSSAEPSQSSALGDQVVDSTLREEKGAISGNPNWHISLRFGEDVLRDGMDPVSFLVYLGKLGEVLNISTLLHSMPSAETMDPESCYLGLEIDLKSDSEKQEIEDVFEFVQDDCQIRILPPNSKVEEYIRHIHNMPEDTLMLGEILVKGGALTKAELEEALMHQTAEVVKPACPAGRDEEPKRPIGEILVEEQKVASPVVNAALGKQKEVREVKARASKSIRIDTEKLDQLINMVGELVITNANIEQQAHRIGDSSLLESASALSRLVEDIRDRAMQVRMVPIGDTFNRFKRVIRDISQSTGKNIELLISGADTELDKSVTEKIGDPLMHLIRNSADHGIEHPDLRLERQKPETGTIHLNAYQETGTVVIEIIDDGGGLSREKILNKAIEKSIVSPDETLSDREIFQLIFAAGFSTAEKVTNVSGRGVGMDVVRRNIENLRGTVELDSAEGKGTTVRIRLPLTMAIIDGFMIKVGDEFYIIPLDMLDECVELSIEERDLSFKRNYINLKGTVLPYVRLREQFNVNTEVPIYEHTVIVEYAGQKTGIVVDELHGEVQAVIKSLGKVYQNVPGISGATILGDGTVALILDIPGLVQAAEKAMKTVGAA